MMKRRQLCAVGLAGAALFITGCGSSGKTITKTVTVASAPVTITKTVSASAPVSNSSGSGGTSGSKCAIASLAKVPNGFKCTSDGVPLVFAHQGAPIHLKSLTAHLNGTSTATSLSDQVSTVTAQGEFVLISLTIANTTTSPQTFANPGTEPTALYIGKDQYSEDFDAENGPDQHSCVALDESPTQPGASLTCDVVYDVPTAAVKTAETDGYKLFVVNYGDDLSSNAVSTPAQVGVFVAKPFS
jgi:Domain of unknown function (DUF4352)